MLPCILPPSSHKIDDTIGMFMIDDISPNVLTEPVYVINNANEYELKWLYFKKTNEVDLENTTAREIAEGKTDVQHKICYKSELHKPGAYECSRCHGITYCNNNKPQVCTACDRNSNFVLIYPEINPQLWRIPIYHKIKDFDLSEMIKVYDETIELLKRTIIFPKDIQYKIFTLWVFSTWKIEYWDAVGFLIFTGEIDSGKTRGLDLLSYLGYRMLQTVGVTFPAMVRATHYYHAGILMDEAHNKLQNKTEQGREMINFIKPSYRRGSHYTVADKEDQTQIISYNNFGFKAFAGEKTIFDRGFLSRSIPFIMEKEYPEIAKLAYVEKGLKQIQQNLLNYRLYTEKPAELDENYKLKGRTREIFESIIRTGLHIDLDVTDIEEYALNIEKQQEDELRETLEHSVLSAISNLSSRATLDDAPEEIQYKKIIEIVWGTDLEQKERRKKGITLGFCIRNLQLKHKRKRDGHVLLFNDSETQRRLKYLYKRYGVQ